MYIGIPLTVTDALEQQAKEIRENRDMIFGNIYYEAESDIRWIGDLGELCFNQWLEQNQIIDYSWEVEDVAGKPDFVINGKRVDVKTVKRRVPPKPNYTAQITARHKDHPIDELFFMSYEFKIKKMWLLGGISLINFLKVAKQYKAGDIVHSNYSIRQGHEIYNAEISLLHPPLTWLEEVMS
jgi:hypothetical protein